ncbi:glycosyltransferase family 1 protein [Cohnella sp. WQ 127256]|uniref:glycosyltransferase family 4 protein n=1 Tax=Cohnella sp. WQ 127256 TaxID=2938790 RepID=UPI002118F01C|nr:glycosyltransferase family 1 protein [Cohnella sp. WQ 127256]
MLTIDVRMINHSGIGTYIRQLVPLVIEKLPNVKICLIGSPNHLSQWIEPYKERVVIRSVDAEVYSLKEQWAMHRAIPQETTLLWTPHYNIPLFYKGKQLVTVHDVFHLAMRRFVKGIHKQWYAKIMFQAVHRKAQDIISVSNFTKYEFEKWVGVTPKLKTIYNGIDQSWYEIEGKAVVVQGSNEQVPYFLYVGNVKPHKNVSVLIRAFRLLADRLPHRLIIVGKKEGFMTEDESVFREMTSLKDRIIFTGFVEEEKLHQYYAQATAFIFPSLYEGFGFPPLEAMAAGTPVIASTSGSLPEVCGDAALYFTADNEAELASAMLRVSSDEELKISLRERGNVRARQYHWSDCAERTAILIKEVIDGESRNYS